MSTLARRRVAPFKLKSLVGGGPRRDSFRSKLPERLSPLVRDRVLLRLLPTYSGVAGGVGSCGVGGGVEPVTGQTRSSRNKEIKLLLPG